MRAGKIIEVSSVFPKGINARTDPATGRIVYLHAEDIAPIPLSTDWLRRLGFRLNAIRWVLPSVSDLYVDRIVDQFHISIARRGDSVCQVHAVHQLQNLLADGWHVELRLRR